MIALAACGGAGESHSHSNLDAGASGAGGSSPSGGAGGASAGGGAGGSGAACGLAGCGRALNIDTGRVDLLFVVDNSGSMQQEQDALAKEFPRMLRKLTTGDHNEDGVPELPPVTDLHLGVVSTNLGGAFDVTGCTDQGDNGLLSHSAITDGCKADYPTFLTYRSGDDANAVATDFGCLAVLGTAGCGYEQPLESALKALWPSSDPTFSFVAQSYADTVGQADRGNAGFVRNTDDSPATLAIVVVSDEDDCSASDPVIWTPPTYLDPDGGSPLLGQPVNLRCFLNPASLYPVDRYLNGFRALHAADGVRVLFAAIVGVPVDLVDQPAMAAVDFNDTAQREAYYQRILDDSRMIETPDSAQDPGNPVLKPSCESVHGKATPPRRIVELARSFGPAGLVQSICGDNFGAPIDIVVRTVVTGPD